MLVNDFNAPLIAAVVHVDCSEVDPCTTEREVGAIVADDAAEYIGVEDDALGRIGHVDGDVMDREPLHGIEPVGAVSSLTVVIVPNSTEPTHERAK